MTTMYKRPEPIPNAARPAAVPQRVARPPAVGGALASLSLSMLLAALGTALGPSLGGILIAGLSWRAIFFVNVPLALIALFLAYRYLPADHRRPTTDKPGFDSLGTLLLALMLGAYALGMTLGSGSF